MGGWGQEVWDDAAGERGAERQASNLPPSIGWRAQTDRLAGAEDRLVAGAEDRLAGAEARLLVGADGG